MRSMVEKLTCFLSGTKNFFLFFYYFKLATFNKLFQFDHLDSELLDTQWIGGVQQHPAHPAHSLHVVSCACAHGFRPVFIPMAKKSLP